MKKALKGLGLLLGILIALVVVFFGSLTFLDKTFLPEEDLAVHTNAVLSLPAYDSFSVTTFNIGYAGLDQGQDFFADGGKSARGESKEKVQENLEAISAVLKNTNSDILFVQEIDTDSRRSYGINELAYLQDQLRQYSTCYAENYNAPWVPVPLFSPLGNSKAGMATFSKFGVAQATRVQLEGQESWPMKLAELDRCMIISKIPLPDGKTLTLINLHLSAYDEGGLLRNQQVKHLFRLMNAAYDKGDYVVVGGDWNQFLSDKPADETTQATWPVWLVPVSEELTSTGFQWCVDDSVMTVRDLDAPYAKGVTFETVIDGFLISPNLEVLSTQTHDLGFENTDHHPVTCVLKFKK